MRYRLKSKTVRLTDGRRPSAYRPTLCPTIRVTVGPVIFQEWKNSQSSPGLLTVNTFKISHFV